MLITTGQGVIASSGATIPNAYWHGINWARAAGWAAAISPNINNFPDERLGAVSWLVRICFIHLSAHTFKNDCVASNKIDPSYIMMFCVILRYTFCNTGITSFCPDHLFLSACLELLERPRGCYPPFFSFTQPPWRRSFCSLVSEANTPLTPPESFERIWVVRSCEAIMKFLAQRHST